MKRFRLTRYKNIWFIFGTVLTITSFNVNLIANYGKGSVGIVFKRKEEKVIDE